MQRQRVVAVFLSTVIAAVAVMATMGGLVLWFGETLNPVRAWWSLELALGGVAVALAIMAVLHVGLLAGEAFSAAAVQHSAGQWVGAWVRVASGEAPEPPTPVNHGYLSLAADFWRNLTPIVCEDKALQPFPCARTRVALAEIFGQVLLNANVTNGQSDQWFVVYRHVVRILNLSPVKPTHDVHAQPL